MPVVPSALALVLGATWALTLGNPYLEQTRRHSSRLLGYCVMGLGAGMDLGVVGRAGAQGIGYTVVGILLTLTLGLALGGALRIPRVTSLLIAVGTAICGGSAIAAVAPVVRAKPHEISVALGTVFLLNAVGLTLFPLIGHALALDETQFGLWAALAIHDTSSVVGATMTYGPRALEVGTTVKLARALWIVPVTLAVGHFWRTPEAASGQSAAPAKRPWFILGFLVAAALVTWFPALRPAGHAVEAIARRGLVLTLFLIGANLTWPTLRAVGARPLLQGLALWIAVGALTLAAVLFGGIR